MVLWRGLVDFLPAAAGWERLGLLARRGQYCVVWVGDCSVHTFQGLALTGWEDLVPG